MSIQFALSLMYSLLRDFQPFFGGLLEMKWTIASTLFPDVIDVRIDNAGGPQCSM